MIPMPFGPTAGRPVQSLRLLLALAPMVGLAACGDKDEGDVESSGTTTILIDSTDADADGFDASEDCDDSDPSVFPGASEICNDIDDDCDGAIDEDPLEPITWAADLDSDGYSDPTNTVDSCTAPSGFIAPTSDADCDDADDGVNPAADELCDDVDNDCDGEVDEDATDETTWYTDADADGYGDPATGVEACSGASDQVDNGEDCDDADDTLSPAADEVCDGIDNDCDDEVDDSPIDAATWYADVDTDGFGDAGAPLVSCDQPTGFVADDTDCNDGDDAVSPAADEVCDGIDNDCDGTSDGADALDAATFYADTDTDGYGDAAVSVTACAAPTGYLSDATDCDDTDAAVSPAGTETCNGIDDDCNGATDELGATGGTDYYADTDADGYGDAGSVVSACSLPSGYATDDTDCDDTEAGVNPGETEVCGDGLDNDCDGTPNTCELSGSYDPSDATATLLGGANESAGGAVVVAGDLDGDGQDDALIGAFRLDPTGLDAGGAYVVAGPLSGTLALDSEATATLEGESVGDYAGYTVGALGDPDGDGYDDIAIGSTGFETGSATRNQGAVYVVHGPVSGTLDLGSADARFTGGALTDFAGFAMAGVGDVDDDGIADLAVGAYAEDSAGTSAGAVYLVSGSISGAVAATDASATILGEAAGDELGISVAGGGDFDGDGVADLAAGARYSDAGGTSSSGAAYLFAGPISGSLTGADADVRVLGSTASDQTGWAVQLAGDFDGDGYDDFVTSAVGAGGNAGAVYVLAGPLSGDVSVSSATATFTGESADDQAGRSLAAGGDLDGDGLHDLLIGAYSRDTYANNAGAVYLVHGPLSGTVALAAADAVFDGDAIGQTAGTTVSSGGDLDGDGLDDALIGAPGDDVGGTNAGVSWLWSGYGM